MEYDEVEDYAIDLVRLRLILIFLVNPNQIESEIQRLQPTGAGDFDDLELNTTVNPALASTYYKGPHGEMVSALTRLNRMLKFTPIIPYLFCNRLMNEDDLAKASFLDLIRWIKPAFTRFLPRPSFIGEPDSIPSGNMSQQCALSNAEHNRAYNRLELIKLRCVKKICQSLVEHTDIQFEGFTVGTGRDSIPSRGAEKIPESLQGSEISVHERLARVGTRLLQFESDRSLLMGDVESIPLEREKFLQWKRLDCEAREIQQELESISELPGVDGRGFH